MRKVPVQTVRYVDEDQVRKVQVQTVHYETEDQVRKVPVTTCRIEYEEHVEQVPVHCRKHCSRVAESSPGKAINDVALQSRRLRWAFPGLCVVAIRSALARILRRGLIFQEQSAWQALHRLNRNSGGDGRSSTAATAAAADEHHPYVPDDAQIPEFTSGPCWPGRCWASSSARRRSIWC